MKFLITMATFYNINSTIYEHVLDYFPISHPIVDYQFTNNEQIH